MKKKLLILILFVTALQRGFSQLTITPEIGYNKTMFNTTAPGTQIVTSPLNRFQIGGLITQSWAKYLFIQSGLEFSQKGSYEGRGYQALYGSNSDIKLSYLQVPLNVGGYIKLYHGINLVVSGGVYAAYGISGTEKGSTLDISGTGTINRNITFATNPPAADNSKTYIKPFDAGYNVSGGLSWQNFILKTTYSKGFGNVSPVSTTVYKNEIWNFTLGYAIKIK